MAITLNEFIEIIKISGKINSSKENIVIDLFDYIGATTSIDSARVIKWFQNERNPKVNMEKHFKNGINNFGFSKYLEENANFSWKKLQKAFMHLDYKDLVDTETFYKEIFYWSLLNQFCDFLNMPKPKKPILLSHRLPKNYKTFGRENSLKKITEVFKNRNYVILTGMSGIGKSHVAWAYAHSLNEYDGCRVQHIICEDSDSLRQMVCRLQFDDLEDDKEEDKKFDLRVKALQTYKQPVLIILDNLNRKLTIKDKHDLQKLTEDISLSHVKWLITTRQQKLVYDEEHIIPICTLCNDSLLDLYWYNRFSQPEKHQDYIDKYTETVENMFEKIGNHTLMIELLAKLPKKTGLDETKMNTYIQHTLYISNRNVTAIVRNECMEDTVKNIITHLFFNSLYDNTNENTMKPVLNEAEKEIMKYMTLLSPSGLKLRLFEELIDYNNGKYSNNEINNLIESRLIIMDDEEDFTIRLHPLIFETIYEMEENEPFYASYWSFSKFNEEIEIDINCMESTEDTEDTEMLLYIQCKNFHTKLCKKIEELQVNVKISPDENADNLSKLRNTLIHISSKIIFNEMMNSPEFSELEPVEKLAYYQINQANKIYIENSFGLEKNIDTTEIWKLYPPSLALPKLIRKIFPEQYDEKDFNDLFQILNTMPQELIEKFLKIEFFRIKNGDDSPELNSMFNDLLEYIEKLYSSKNDNENM